MSLFFFAILFAFLLGGSAHGQTPSTDVTRMEAVGDAPILYVIRHPYRSHYHAIDTLFSPDEFNVDLNRPHKTLFSPDAELKLFSTRTGKTATLVQTPAGVLRDPDLGFDADRVIFALRTDPDSEYHLWELTLDGISTFDEILDQPEQPLTPVSDGLVLHHPDVRLTQLTFEPLAADFDPIYLGDGSVVFASTRDPKYNMCSRDLASDLYRMNGDGTNLYQITRGTLFEHNPTLLPDGRICYHRWEYVDRNFGDAHALWTVNPDGTNQSVYWGNNTAVPGGVYNPVFIEDTQELLCIFGPHHNLENGAVAILNRRLGVDGAASVVWTIPEDFHLRIREEGGFDCDTTVGAVPLKYEDPFPLDADHFLVTRQMEEKSEKTGLFLLDRDRNETLLLEDRLSVYDPICIRRRDRPPVAPPKRDFGQNDGVCRVVNVYEGTHMNGVEPGSVKFLRVVESPPKRNFSAGQWNAQGYTAPGMNWHGLENKRILGTVRVEEDGSAAFRVPCDTFLYFQLLDERGRMIQTMRSGTVLQSGENVVCIGCHEDRTATNVNTPKTAVTIAAQREPQRLADWYGPARDFSFMAEVQPVLNRHCVECHDYGKSAGERLNLAPDRDLVFNTAYVELWLSDKIACIGGGPAELLDAGFWGSRASKMIDELSRPQIREHAEAGFPDRMTREDFDRLITWLDLNAVYYPCYESAYPESRTGRTPLTREEFQRLGELAGVNADDWAYHENKPRPLVTFERPENSPVLKVVQDRIMREKTLSAADALGDAEYQEALDLIRRGGKRLQEKPRADMAGFSPCEKDRERLEKADQLRAKEMNFRTAIRQGDRMNDQ